MGKKDKKKAAPPPAEVPIVWKGKPIDLVIHVPPKVAAGQKFDYTCPDGEVVHLTCPRPYPKEGNFRWRWNGPGAPAPRDVKVPHGVKAGDTFVITLKEDGRKIPVTCPTPLPPTGEFTYTPPRRWSTSAATHTATLLKTPLGFGIHLTADNVITAIDEGSQAARDGHFKVGDQVCSLNETPLSPEVTLSSVLAEFSNGEHVVFGLHCRESLTREIPPWRQWLWLTAPSIPVAPVAHGRVTLQPIALAPRLTQESPHGPELAGACALRQEYRPHREGARRLAGARRRPSRAFPPPLPASRHALLSTTTPLALRGCPRRCRWACRPRRCRWACRTRRQSPRLCSRRHRVIRALPRASRTQVLPSRPPPCPMIAAAPSHRHR